MVWDSASNLAEFMGLERSRVNPGSPQGFRQGLPSSIKEALLQVSWTPWQLWQGGRFLAKNLLPQCLWGIQQDRAVLQQLAPAPELGTPYPLAPSRMHQVGGCAEGKAVAFPQVGRLIAKDQGSAKGFKGQLQPNAAEPVGLPARSRGPGPDQGVGEFSGVQNGAPATGPPDQIDHPLVHQIGPVGFEMALVKPQRQGGAPPAIEAKGRPALVEQPAIDGHLPSPIQLGGGHPAGFLGGRCCGFSHCPRLPR